MFNYVFQGPPDATIAAPGTPQAPADGIDTVNSVEYISAGNGWKPAIPATVGTKDFLAQGANLGATTVLAVPAHMGGQYRVTAYSIKSRAATTSSTQPSLALSWTDNDNSTAQSIATLLATDANNNLTSPVQATAVINAKGGTNIQVTGAGFASVGGTSMQYLLKVRVDYLG